MNLDDLKLLAGVAKSADTPVQEQPQLGDMRTLIALVTPEQLNQLQSSTEEAVEEEGFANSGDEYAGEPEEYKGTLGSPADLSLRRYLGANGMPVNVDEAKVYEDHKVEDITEAYAQYKAEQNEEVSVTEAPYQYDMTDKGDMHDALGAVQNSMDDAVESIQKAAGLASQISDAVEDTLYTDESVEEAEVTEGKVGTPGSLDKVEAQIEKLKDMAKESQSRW